MSLVFLVLGVFTFPRVYLGPIPILKELGSLDTVAASWDSRDRYNLFRIDPTTNTVDVGWAPNVRGGVSALAIDAALRAPPGARVRVGAALDAEVGGVAHQDPALRADAHGRGIPGGRALSSKPASLSRCAWATVQ